MRQRRLPQVMIEDLESRRLFSVLGVDAADYQYNLNWVTVKADGYTFAWEKATQGTTYVNSTYFNSNITAAKAAGVPIGAYCFADFNDSPASDANDFWNEIKSTISGTDKLTLQPMLDCESYETGNEDSWVATWSSTLKADAAAYSPTANLTLTPIIYTDSSFAADYFTTATSKNFPLWIATPGNTSPSSSQITPWTNFEIVQYGERTFPATTSSGTAESPETDEDEINSSEPTGELNNLIVGSGLFAINSYVETKVAVTAYANANSTGTSHAVAVNVSGQVLSLPVYYNNAWMFDVQFSTGVTGYVNETSLTQISSAPAAPTNVSPANGSTVTAPPTLTWSTDSTATSYNVYLNNSEVASNLTTTSYATSNLSAGTYNWYIQAVNAIGSTNGASWTFTYTLPVPSATLVTELPSAGDTTLQFPISYTDPIAVNASTFATGNITVTGPNGYSQIATFISASPSGNGTPRNATYQIGAPNGVFDVLADGTYTVTMNANQVKDTSGSYVPAGTIGTFTVSEPFAYINSSNQLVVNSTSANSSISLYKSGSYVDVSNGSSVLTFNPVGYTSVNFVGTSGNDSLSISTALGVPLSFNGGAGNDSLTLSAGTLSFATDLGAATSALTIDLDNSAQINFSSDQHLAALNLYNNSVVALAAGGTIALETGSLDIEGSAAINIADDALVIYGSDVDTVTSYLDAGFDAGAWDGAGGIDSSVAANSLGETLGMAPATSLSYSTINMVSFSNTAIVVRYTYKGDANLDGTVNSDDLSLLVLSLAQEQSAQTNNQPAPTQYWYTGDFNYDMQVNADDFMQLAVGSAVQNEQVLG